MSETWTSGSSSSRMFRFGDASACIEHRIMRRHARGSNQVMRREYGECTICGRAFRRVIRWDTKDARSWWEPVEEAA